MTDASHWNQIYDSTPTQRLGWYKNRLATSVELIARYGSGPKDRVIDFGGGSSSLVDSLLERGFSDLSVLDLSQRALDISRERLTNQEVDIKWICADMRTCLSCGGPYDVWHDRAAFHFLGDVQDINHYRNLLIRSLAPDGILVLGVFSENAPPKCSGLPVTRYSLDKLQTLFGAEFRLLESRVEKHTTPGGTDQEYLYSAWRRT